MRTTASLGHNHVFGEVENETPYHIVATSRKNDWPSHVGEVLRSDHPKFTC